MSSERHPLADRTLVMSGGSRGIGLAIALGAAKLGANVVLLAKTGEPHPKLPGTVHTAVAEVEAAGGKGLAVVGDVRKEEDVQRAVDAAVERFGGVDIVVNNASAIAVEPTEQLSAKKFDLMQQINTLSKYGMTLLSLGWAAEFASERGGAGIGFSCLWPQTYIATSAVSNLAGGDTLMSASRSPVIMADAAVAILTKPAAEANGQCFVDADVLTASGVTDLSRYGGGDDPMWDIFLDKL